MTNKLGGPDSKIIIKLFKLLNEEKKKNKTRESLLNAIRNFSTYLSIPKDHERYLLELYVLNFKEDGDYSNLTKDNFIDPRYQKGKVISNSNARLYTIAQLPFKGSNLTAYWTIDPKGVPYYKVSSYEWYPIYIYKNDKWYQTTNSYSSSTGRQISNSNPVDWSNDLKTVYTLTSDEMKMLERGNSHEEIMKYKRSKLKSIEPDLTKRQKTAKIGNSYHDRNLTPTNIKFKVNSIDTEGDKSIVNVDVYDVVKRQSGKQQDTPENYLNNEIPNLTTTNVEDAIKIKLRRELVDYIGTRFKDNLENPVGAKIEFKFNHLKK